VLGRRAGSMLGKCSSARLCPQPLRSLFLSPCSLHCLFAGIICNSVCFMFSASRKSFSVGLCASNRNLFSPRQDEEDSVLSRPHRNWNSGFMPGTNRGSWHEKFNPSRRCVTHPAPTRSSLITYLYRVLLIKLYPLLIICWCPNSMNLSMWPY
jgi:hypothetical protein